MRLERPTGYIVEKSRLGFLDGASDQVSRTAKARSSLVDQDLAIFPIEGPFRQSMQ